MFLKGQMRILPNKIVWNIRKFWKFTKFSKKCLFQGFWAIFGLKFGFLAKITSVYVLRTPKDLLAVIFQVGRLIWSRVVYSGCRNYGGVQKVPPDSGTPTSKVFFDLEKLRKLPVFTKKRLFIFLNFSKNRNFENVRFFLIFQFFEFFKNVVL